MEIQRFVSNRRRNILCSIKLKASKFFRYKILWRTLFACDKRNAFWKWAAFYYISTEKFMSLLCYRRFSSSNSFIFRKRSKHNQEQLDSEKPIKKWQILNCAQEFHSLSEESRMLLMLLMSFVLQGSSGSGGDCTPPSGATLSIMWREISVDACGADFPRRCFVASSSLDSSGDILENDRIDDVPLFKLKVYYLLFLPVR